MAATRFVSTGDLRCAVRNCWFGFVAVGRHESGRRIRLGLGAGRGAADDAVDQGRFAGKGAARVSAAADGARRSGRISTACGNTRFGPKAEEPAGRNGTARSWCRFAVESALSGVKKPVQPDERLWYRRTFRVADADRQASGCCCTSAPSIGSARCGSTARKSASTRAATIRSRSTSPMHCAGRRQRTGRRRYGSDRHRHQPRGKQVLKPHGILYTAVTGIWQTVWLEPVPAAAHRVAQDCADVDRGVVTVTVEASRSATACA